MNALVLTAQLTTALLPVHTSDVGEPVIADQHTQSETDTRAASHPSGPPLEIEVGAAQAQTADVTIPAQQWIGGVRLGTTTLPGPSGPGWSLRVRVSAPLPLDLGRFDLGYTRTPFLVQERPDYGYYRVTVPVLESRVPVSASNAYVGADRSFQTRRFNADWSRTLAARHGWTLGGRLSMRIASISHSGRDQVFGPEEIVRLAHTDPTTACTRIEVHAETKSTLLKPHVGLDLRRSLAGGATLELNAGLTVQAAWEEYSPDVPETCVAPAFCSVMTTYFDDGTSQTSPFCTVQPICECRVRAPGKPEGRRVEWLPDVTLSLRVPLCDHFALRAGYYWERWGRDWAGDLGASGVFFAATLVIGH